MEATENSTPTNAEGWAASLATLAGELVNAGEVRAREDAARRIGAILAQSAKTAPAKPTPEQLMGFSVPTCLYALAREASADDVQTQLSARLSQLSAMLAMTNGAGFQSFKLYSEATQENYLWSCSTLADECEELLGALSELTASERGAA